MYSPLIKVEISKNNRSCSTIIYAIDIVFKFSEIRLCKIQWSKTLCHMVDQKHKSHLKINYNFILKI